MQIEILNPHGFCAGVTGALRKALALSADPATAPLYCLHELVHNELVVASMRARGFVFVEDVADVPAGATLLFSAHGVAPSVRAAAESRRLKVVDATCPFVAKVHVAARAYAERGLAVVVVGKAAHAEVKGILGEVEAVGGVWATVASVADVAALPGFSCGLGVVSQTTMNADDVAEIVAALRARFAVESVAEVCNATKVRQDAVKRFDGDALLVLGSANSSNTRRLCEVAHCRTFRAGSLDDLGELSLDGVRRLGVTSGASTPESFFDAAIRRLSERNA